MVVFGLASVSVLGQSSMSASLVSLFAGVFLGTIGTEAQYGVERFVFNVPFLKTGVDFVTVLIGLFAIGEVLDQLASTASAPVPVEGTKAVIPRLPSLRDLWPLRWPLARGTAVGIAVGGLAGAGATVSSFVSYGLLGLAHPAARHGVILGPMAEQYFLTSMVSNANDVSIFVIRPVSVVILLLSAAMVLWPTWKARCRSS